MPHSDETLELGAPGDVDVPVGDPLDEAHDVRVRVLASVFTIRCGSDGVRRRVAEDWSRCLAPNVSTRSSAAPMELPVYTDQGAYLIASQLNRLAIDELAGEYLMLHAGGLANERGEVVALVGPSGTGKTTASHLLAKSGLGYVTDETVAIAPDGSVLPFPKPLSIHDDAEPSGRKVQRGPDELGLGQAPERLALRRIVLLNRKTDTHVSPRLQHVPIVEALLTLIPQTSALPRLRRPLASLCQAIARCGGVFQLTYSEIGEAGDLVRELLAADMTAVPETWGNVLAGPVDPDDMTWALMDGKVRRRPAMDALRLDDEAVVMVDSTPSRLSPLGLALWEASSGGRLPEDLIRIAEAEFGSHPDAPSLVTAALDAMCEANVLSRGLPMTIDEVLSAV